MASNTEMKHPNGDVKVIPNELVKRYEERGWENTKASKSSTSGSSK